ncbi:hypothetical protein FRB90_009004, partial [Tulasnella sp. 427]
PTSGSSSHLRQSPKSAELCPTPTPSALSYAPAPPLLRGILKRKASDEPGQPGSAGGHRDKRFHIDESRNTVKWFVKDQEDDDDDGEGEVEGEEEEDELEDEEDQFETEDVELEGDDAEDETTVAAQNVPATTSGASSSTVTDEDIHYDVSFDCSETTSSDIYDVMAKGVDTEAPPRHRWLSVEIVDLPPTSDSIKAVNYILKGADSLKSVTVKSRLDMPPENRDNTVLQIRSKNLKVINITGFIPKLQDMKTFGQLETLRLHHPMGFNLTHFDFIMADQKNLRCLELVEVRPLEGRSQRFVRFIPYHLPELRELKIQLLGRETIAMAQIFSRMRAPKCRRLEMSIDLDGLAKLPPALDEKAVNRFDVWRFLGVLGTWISDWRLDDSLQDRSVSKQEPAINSQVTSQGFRWHHKSSERSSRSYSGEVLLLCGDRVKDKVLVPWLEEINLYYSQQLLVQGVKFMGERCGKTVEGSHKDHYTFEDYFNRIRDAKEYDRSQHRCFVENLIRTALHALDPHGA